MALIAWPTNEYKLMCFDRNINGNGDVKFLECDYFFVQRCLKLTSPLHSIITHIYENHFKFEVSLHFWRIWPSVWRLNGNCCENSKVHNNFLKKTTLRHVSGFLLHPLNSKIPKSSIFLTIGIPSGSSKGIQKPSIFPIRILMSSPLLYCIVIKV